MKEIKDLGAIQDNRFLGNSTNIKELYIVVTDESNIINVNKSAKTFSTKETYFAMRVDETNATIKMTGYNVTHNSEFLTHLKNAKTYNDAIDIAKNESLELEVLTFPWHRIIRIKQLKYTLAK